MPVYLFTISYLDGSTIEGETTAYIDFNNINAFILRLTTIHESFCTNFCARLKID